MKFQHKNNHYICHITRKLLCLITPQLEENYKGYFEILGTEWQFKSYVSTLWKVTKSIFRQKIYRCLYYTKYPIPKTDWKEAGKRTINSCFWEYTNQMSGKIPPALNT